MAIKRVMRMSEIAQAPFRSLQDVQRLLDTIKSAADDEDNLLRQYERQFAKLEKQELLAATKTFVITPDGGNAPTINYEKFKRSDQIHVQKVDKFNIPNMDGLKNNFAIVDELTEKIDQLNVMYGTVAINFKGQRGQDVMLRNITSMRVSLEQKLKKAKDFLEAVGRKYLPTKFKELVEETSSLLAEHLTYSKALTEVYVTAGEKKGDPFLFTFYIKLINLLDPEEDEQIPELYIVFSSKLVPSSIIDDDTPTLDMSYYVTMMRSFETPGHFNPGKQVRNSNEAMRELSHLLSIELGIADIGALPFNLDLKTEDKTKLKAGKMISEIEAAPDAMTFWLQKNLNQTDLDKVIRDLFVDLTAMLKTAKIKNPSLTYKKVVKDEDPKNRKKRYGVTFRMAMPAQHDQVDVQMRDFLKDHFKLDDTKIRRVVQIINGRD